ncbi:MAG: hypothetical protein J6J06_07770, partial [Bacteroidaceae bacterium]|nr:hypothetical protein [Bacteroidaceae bacterium]
ERRDSTNRRNAYGTNWLRSIDVNSVSRIAKGIIVLRNIGVNVINTRIDFLNPSVLHSSTVPLYCYATQRSKRLPFLPASIPSGCGRTPRTTVLPMAHWDYGT